MVGVITGRFSCCQYMGKNLKDLQTSIDSMGVRLDSIKDVNAKSIYDPVISGAWNIIMYIA